MNSNECSRPPRVWSNLSRPTSPFSRSLLWPKTGNAGSSVTIKSQNWEAKRFSFAAPTKERIACFGDCFSFVGCFL